MATTTLRIEDERKVRVPAAEDLGAVLLVGGTGMLADASRWIAGQARHVTLVARAPEALAQELGAEAVALDWKQLDATERISALSARFDLAVLWLHDDSCSLARPFENQLLPGGRLVRVHGAQSADPAVRAAREPDPRPGLRRQVVILGWHPEVSAPDGQRWLSDAEISAGVIAAICHPALEALTVGGASG